jgi:AmmeMemoRadiSam system protein B
LHHLPFLSVAGIRRAAVSGSFYPKGAEELSERLEGLLEKADSKPRKGVFGLISPHPGLDFGGGVACRGFSSIENDYDTVFILGPSHRHPFRGISISNYERFETPLGEVEVDNEMRNELLSDLFFLREDNLPHEREHSIEMQLIFLQKRLKKGFKIIPLVFGFCDSSISGSLSKKIYEIMKRKDKKVLVVVSADLSHYHSYKRANTLDGNCIESIVLLDEKRFLERLDSGDFEVDAPFAILTLIRLSNLLGGNCELLIYKNSGDVTGDMVQGVVGYASIIFQEGRNGDK